jgi:hypothetical protein
MSKMSDYENLERTRFEFKTRNDNQLIGYLYENKNIDKNKLSNLLDYELFEEIITLYNSCL